MSDRRLKPGWRRVKFGDVVRLSRERCAEPAAAGLERYVGLEHLDPGDLCIRRWGLIAGGTTFTNRFKPGHVLFGKRRAYQRKLAVADFSGICSSDIYVLEPADDELLPELLPFICQTNRFFDYAVGTSAGSLSPRTNWASLADYEFGLPSMTKQRKIAELLRAIEAHLSSLRLVKQQATLLFDATAQTRLTPDGLRLRTNRTLASVPDGWRAMTMRDVCPGRGDAVIGPFGSDLLATDYLGRTSGVPVVFVRDVRPNSFQYVSDVFISEEKAGELSAHEALPGDVVVTKMGVPEAFGIPPGLSAVVPPTFPRGIVTADVIRVRPDPQLVLANYLAYLLNCPWGRQQTARISPGSTTRFKMTLQSFLAITLPIPPLRYQHRVVDELEVLRGARSRTDLPISADEGLRASFNTLWD